MDTLPADAPPLLRSLLPSSMLASLLQAVRAMLDAADWEEAERSGRIQPEKVGGCWVGVWLAEQCLS